MGKNFKGLTVWIAVGCFLFILAQAFSNNYDETSTVPYSEFLNDVDNGKVSQAVIRGFTVNALYSDGHTVVTYNPQDLNLVQRLL
ncbi:MAG: ATP-dependent metallopeptidase FtsH/Yme1/Tma family protein, partial [Alphaproteobacteria bacterium]|nr:ATP-dependent metallopeptidase FtsH/Yme1/Tma family protein [Alphaproteobacteria bacterium]